MSLLKRIESARPAGAGDENLPALSGQPGRDVQGADGATAAGAGVGTRRTNSPAGPCAVAAME